jgi:hypothetical protein
MTGNLIRDTKVINELLSLGNDDGVGFEDVCLRDRATGVSQQHGNGILCYI